MMMMWMMKTMTVMLMANCLQMFNGHYSVVSFEDDDNFDDDSQNENKKSEHSMIYSLIQNKYQLARKIRKNKTKNVTHRKK